MAGGNWGQREASILLGRRLSQITWMRTFQFQQYLEQYLRETGVVRHMRGDMAQAVLSQGLIEQWAEGQSFIPSPSAAAALRSAVAVMTEDRLAPPLRRGDLPCHTGLLSLPGDLYGMSEIDGAWVKRGVSAVSWGPCQVDATTPGVLVSSWTHRDAHQDEVLMRHKGSVEQVRAVAQDAAQGVREVRSRIAQDTESDPEELQALDSLATERLQVARRMERQVESSQGHIPDFLLNSMDPVPLGKPYMLGQSKEEPQGDRHSETVSFDRVDPEADTLSVRLVHALWGLLSAGILHPFSLELLPKTEKKYAKKDLNHEVIGLDLALDVGDDSLVTVTRQRIETPTMKGSGRMTKWGADPFIGGKVK